MPSKFIQIKVGSALKNSGNFKSNEHRNFVFLPKIAWDIKAQSWLPYNKLLHLSIKINCHKVELVSYYHHLMVPKGISEWVLWWNLILSNTFFLGCIEKMLMLWVRHHFMEEKICFENADWDQYFRGWVANFEPLYNK